MTRVVLSAAAFSADAELSRFARGRTAATGALASFVGYCRATSDHGAVEEIVLDHYPGFTEKEIERLSRAVAERYELIDLLVIHRIGAVPAGEPIVLVAALSSHRAAAFAAVSEMMDYLKTDAPFWKREQGPDGARWIDPTAADYARREEHAK